jgi:hypothetical protein
MTALGPAAAGGLPADWMRAAALLAVAHHVQSDEAAGIDPRRGWPERVAEWQDLAQRAADLPLSPEAWAEAAALAAERFPEAAAAFSILAENPGLHLPTPTVFARIALAGLGLDFDTALAAALAAVGGGIELTPPPGLAVPATQWGMRLSTEGLARGFRRVARPGGTLAAATHRPVLARPARAAARILAADGAVWIRSASRRMARQLAADLAALLPARGFDLVDLRPGEPVPAADGPLPLVLDLFGLDAAPRLPQPAPASAGMVILAPDRFDEAGIRAVDAPAFTAAEALAVWQAAGIPPATAAALAPRFRLTLAELHAARLEAETLEALSGDEGGTAPAPAGPARFAQAVLAAGARRMGPFVTPVVSDVTLDDLVAAPGIHAQLADAIAWRRTDAQVWGEMGLPRDAGETPGLSLLFSGPPGGGKTFAARCLANALGLNLYRVDLSQVISKYIGETEKRLAQIFDEAEAGHGVLFFDEADAVFGKRSEVKDAHDRYANIEVGFLLQRLESFAGVVVLATNLRSNLDPAFSRRMQFIIDFPMPQQAERERLWRRNLPAPDWCEPDLDLPMLAERFRLAGGNIRNAAVAAAHLAAADGTRLGPRHIARALVRELEKSGLPRGPGDLGPLADWLEESA